MQLQDRSLTLHGAMVCICGDIPASNYIGGFKEGVAFALRKCRRYQVGYQQLVLYLVIYTTKY